MSSSMCLSFSIRLSRSLCSRYKPDSQALSPALRLFFQAWMDPLKPLTWVWWWGWPAGDQSRWGAPGRPSTAFTLLRRGTAGEEVNDGWVGVVDFAKCLDNKKKKQKVGSAKKLWIYRATSGCSCLCIHPAEVSLKALTSSGPMTISSFFTLTFWKIWCLMRVFLNVELHFESNLWRLNCKNSYTVSSVALQEHCQVWKNNPDDWSIYSSKCPHKTLKYSSWLSLHSVAYIHLSSKMWFGTTN